MKWTERSACQVLGLSSPTTLKEAKKAYHVLAQDAHPDKGGDEERFKQISSAYQYLASYYEGVEPPGTTQSKQPKAKAGRSQSRHTQSQSTQHSSAHQGKSTHQQKSTHQKPSGSDSSGSRKKRDDADHREAWRAWREQVDQHAQRKTQQTQTKQSKRPSSHSQKPSSSAHTQQASPPPSTGDIVEASVVPTLGDHLRRWGEAAGERIDSAREGIQARFNRWYRHSARGLFERGKDEKLKLMIDLQTLLHGKQQRIAFNRAVPCPSCQHAKGKLRKSEHDAAATWAEGCTQCGGEGRVIEREELNIYVPPGADHGHKLKVNDRGSAGLNGQPDGHLFLLLTPEELPRGYSRRGAELELQQGVSTELLSQGGVLPIKTLRGVINIKVPPNFRSGKKLLIPNQGLPTWGDPETVGSLTVCLRALI